MENDETEQKEQQQPIAIVKNCKNCAHKNGYEMSFASCLVTGRYIANVRSAPGPRDCDANFNRWEDIPPKPSVVSKIKKAYKWLTSL